MASPLLQGGLGIPIKITFKRNNADNLKILMDKVKDVEYPIAREYIDNSKDILNQLGVQNDDECDDGDDSDFEVDFDKEED